MRAAVRARSGDPDKPRLVILELVGSRDVEPAVAKALTEALTAAAGRTGLFQVTSQAEVANLLGLERQRELLGCAESSSSCTAELAGALGAQFLMSGSVTKLGQDAFQLSLQVQDTARAMTLGRASRIASDLASLRALVPVAFAEASATPPPPSPSREVVPAGSVGDQPYSVVLTKGGPWVEPLPAKDPIAVSGRTGWVVGQLPAHADAGTSSLFAWDFDIQVLPIAVWSFPGTATAATGRELPDGGALTLVATGDAVRFFDGSRSGVAFVPSPQATVTSIALAPDALGTRFAGGYVVANGRVFRFRADNPVVWRVDELLVSDDEAVEVFFDGSRGRVGLRDGSVVSLPTRVLVAPPTTARALDFEQYCQHTFVLTETGLEHLSVTSGFPVGQWSPVIGRAATPGPRRGFLYGRPGSLLVFWFDGRITELRGLTCEP